MTSAISTRVFVGLRHRTDSQSAKRGRVLCLAINAPGPASQRDGDQLPDRGTGAASTSGNGAAGITWKYRSEDGHLKATLEEAFGGINTAQVSSAAAPWLMGWQVNERNVQWSDDLKVRMVMKFAAQKADLTDAQLDDRLHALLSLLPDIAPKLSAMKVDILAALVLDVDAVAARLLALKRIFPAADCSRLLTRDVGLLWRPLEEVETSAAALQGLLPRMDARDVDGLVQEHPSVLSVESFAAAVEDARRLMPTVAIERLLVTQPEMVLALQKGTDMIPYDAIPNTKFGHP